MQLPGTISFRLMENLPNAAETGVFAAGVPQKYIYKISCLLFHEETCWLTVFRKCMGIIGSSVIVFPVYGDHIFVSLRALLKC